MLRQNVPDIFQIAIVERKAAPFLQTRRQNMYYYYDVKAKLPHLKLLLPRSLPKHSTYHLYKLTCLCSHFALDFASLFATHSPNECKEHPEEVCFGKRSAFIKDGCFVLHGHHLSNIEFRMIWLAPQSFRKPEHNKCSNQAQAVKLTKLRDMSPRDCRRGGTHDWG